MNVVLVDLAALLLVVLIVWFFFGRRRDEARATEGPERQEILVRVKGGYIPEVIRARPDVPLRIQFKREETSPCSDEVVFPGLGVRRHLPAFETTAVDLPGTKAGSYPFACGMDMLHGLLIVGDAPPPATMPQPAAADPD